MFACEAGAIRRRRLMPAVVAASLSLLMAGEALADAAVPLVIESKIPLGEIRGRIDHLAADVKRQRL